MSQLTTKTDPTTAKLFWEMMKLPKDIYDDPNRLITRQIEQYRKYIRIMDMTARHYNVKSMFFLAARAGRRQGADPRREARHTGHDLRSTLCPDRARPRDAERRRIAVRSLLDIYANEKETIYADNIHAYQAPGGESRGYRIMAARMAQNMAEGWGLQAKAKQ
jgi:hypothetical protein